MKILYLLSDGPSETTERLMSLHMTDNEVSVVDISSGRPTGEEIVKAIFTADRVVSW